MTTSNTIRASLSFSFKGETHELDSVIDLDRCFAESVEEPNFHHLLARAHGIDTYSYLYDALESYEIEFSAPTGVAIHCCHDGCLDWSQFVQRVKDAADLQVVQRIAARILNVPDLAENPAHAGLKEALLAAYRAGKAS